MKSQNLNLELEEAVRKENEINVDDEDMAERYVTVNWEIFRENFIFVNRVKRHICYLNIHNYDMIYDLHQYMTG